MNWTENIPAEDGYYYAATDDAQVKVFIVNLYNVDTCPVIMVTRDAPLKYGVAHDANVIDYWGEKIEMPVTEAATALPRAKKPHLGMKCLTCNAVIFSEHRHDFVWCSCKLPDGKGEEYAVFVDGGYDYFRNGAGSKANFIFVQRLPDGNVEEFRNDHSS